MGQPGFKREGGNLVFEALNDFFWERSGYRDSKIQLFDMETVIACIPAEPLNMCEIYNIGAVASFYSIDTFQLNTNCSKGIPDKLPLNYPVLVIIHQYIIPVRLNTNKIFDGKLQKFLNIFGNNFDTDIIMII